MKYQVVIFYILILIYFIIGSCNISAQDSDSLYRERNPLVQNPAIRPYLFKNSHTDIGIGFMTHSGNGYFSQVGKLKNTAFFRANSILKNESYSCWGGASFTKGSIADRRWNESSDYHLVYPYVMADSVSAANLQFECYSFNGGYMGSIDRLLWGLDLKYRALREYRTTDPRPDNISSEITLSSGCGYPIGKNYLIGVGFTINRYIQKDELKFFNEKSSPMVYHLTGIGRFSHLFSGKNYNIRFDGLGYGVNIQLANVINSGFSAGFEYYSRDLDKLMVDFQYLQIAKIKEDILSANISWRFIGKSDSYTVSAKAAHFDRIGIENRFNSPQFGNYDKINSIQMYHSQISVLQLDLKYNNFHNEKSIYSIVPHTSFERMTESYQAPSIHRSIMLLSGGLSADLTYILKRKQRLSIMADITYRQKISATFDKENSQIKLYDTELIMRDHNNYSSNKLLFNMSCERTFSHFEKFLWYLRLSTRLTQFNTYKLNYYEISIGIVI